MPKVSFTSALKRFFPELSEEKLPGSTISEVLDQLEKRHPGLKDYLVDERGVLRKHVNIYIGEALLEERNDLKVMVDEDDEILIFQALSGG
ncbi:MAG: MoaD/ThiS family protein [Saprospiraceae bacterium]|nr:MoaD/ThiS family protein [Saprospiraceae bacterium]